MKVLRHIKSSNTKEIVNYPTMPGEDVPDLSSDIEFYEIQRDDLPIFNASQFSVNEVITLTENVKDHLKIAEISYELVENSVETITSLVTADLGVFLDTEYPVWKRVKHHVEVNELRWTTGIENFDAVQLNRYAFIMNVHAWVDACRYVVKQALVTLTETGVLPDITYGEIPAFE